MAPVLTAAKAFIKEITQATQSDANEGDKKAVAFFDDKNTTYSNTYMQAPEGIFDAEGASLLSCYCMDYTSSHYFTITSPPPDHRWLLQVSPSRISASIHLS